MFSRLIHFFLALALSFTTTYAQKDSIDRDAPDFVEASLLIASPGEVLYSCVGHACLRLECPAYGLDYCFSYEGEDVEHEFLRFFAGKLKMGMFAVPTNEYLKQFREEHRKVWQYPLQLPIVAKQNLWRILDEKVAEGTELPYDYFERGCALTTLQFLMEAVSSDSLEIQFASWPEKYQLSCREIFFLQTKEYPWTNLFINTLMGTKVDEDKEAWEKVLVPTDLVEVLRGAKINGNPVIDEKPTVLVTAETLVKKPAITPMMVSGFFLLLTVLSALLSYLQPKWRFETYVGMLLLTIQTILGLFVCYLVFFSDLPCTEWNWLVIPFNPLPAVFWKWRKYYALPYAAVLILWALAMLLAPHQLTDWSYVVFAFALALVYLDKKTILMLSPRKK